MIKLALTLSPSSANDLVDFDNSTNDLGAGSASEKMLGHDFPSTLAEAGTGGAMTKGEVASACLSKTSLRLVATTHFFKAAFASSNCSDLTTSRTQNINLQSPATSY